MSGEALGRRLVACKGFRWMPGMLAIFDEEEGGCRCRIDGDKGVGNAEHARDAEAEPLLTDPATLGCVLALVREAFGDAELHCMPSARDGWLVWRGSTDHGAHIAQGATEAEALVAALEAAP